MWACKWGPSAWPSLFFCFFYRENNMLFVHFFLNKADDILFIVANNLLYACTDSNHIRWLESPVLTYLTKK
jgi:hypothetical protein